MKLRSYLIDLTNIACVVLSGVLFFFTIIGVFGLKFAIAGLLLFVIGAIAVFRTFPSEGTEK